MRPELDAVLFLELVDERRDFFDRLDEGRDGGELRADVHLQAAQLDVGQLLGGARRRGRRWRSKSTPNLFSDLPVEMYLWVLASTFGFTRTAAGAIMPSSPATSLR